MKKLLVVFAAAFVALSLAACGGSTDLPEEEPQEVNSPITVADLENKCFAQTKTLNAEELQVVKDYLDTMDTMQNGLGNALDALKVQYYYYFNKESDGSLWGETTSGFTYYYKDGTSSEAQEDMMNYIEDFLNLSRFEYDWNVQDNKIIINNLEPYIGNADSLANLEFYGYCRNSKIVITYPKASAASVYMGTGSADVTHTLSQCSTIWIEDGDEDIYVQNDVSADDIAEYGKELTKGADADYTQNGYDIVLTDAGAYKFLCLMLIMKGYYTEAQINAMTENNEIPGYFLVYNKKVYNDLPINPANYTHGLTADEHYTVTHYGLVRVLTDAGKAKLEDPTS